MLDLVVLFIASIMITIGLLSAVLKWSFKKEIEKRFPFLISADALHRWLCDIIPPQPQGKAESISLPREMFNTFDASFDSKAAYDRLLDLLAKLKADGRARYSIETDSVWIRLQQRANIKTDKKRS